MVDGLMTSEQIREAAGRLGLTSGRKLAAATGVNVCTCHKLLKGQLSLREETLARFTVFFRRAEGGGGLAEHFNLLR